MAEYHVMWEIELDASDSVDAARKAQEIQRDPDSLATVFEVTRVHDDAELGTRRSVVTDTVDLDAPTPAPYRTSPRPVLKR